MERHELINKYEKRLQKENPSRIEQLYCEIIRDLTELEQTKVVVPGFVAEWIEQCKEKKNRLLTALLYTPGEVNSWVDDPDNQETFALAWMFGYTIKKEPRYFVEIKATKHRFAKYGNGRIYFSLKYESAFTQAEKAR
jgi:protein gp51